MPWNAEVGKAWWLLCHDSPNEIRLNSQTFRLSSDEREVPPAPEVADRVDRERDVVEQEDADRAAPEQRRQRALPGADDRVADRCRHDQRDDEPEPNSLLIVFMPRSASRSGTYFEISARPSATNSQPTCAWKRFFVRSPEAVRRRRCAGCAGRPPGRRTGGACDGRRPSSSTGPSTAIEPRIANVQRSHCFVWNARWVKSRW